MKRNPNAEAVAQNPSVHSSKKVVKAVVAQSTYSAAIKESKIGDTNKLSADDLSAIKTIDARLQELYYLTDEEDIIGFC
jgi:hypothetical protein